MLFSLGPVVFILIFSHYSHKCHFLCMQISNFLPCCRPHHHLATVVLKQSMDTSDSMVPGEEQSAKEAMLPN